MQLFRIVFQRLWFAVVIAGLTSCSSTQDVILPAPSSAATSALSPTPRPTGLSSPTQSMTPLAPSTLMTFDVGMQPREIAVADFDNDNLMDVAVANAGDGSLTVFRGTGETRLLSSPISIPAGQEPSDVDAVDVDRDEDVDLIVANHGTPNVTILLNDGHGRFEEAGYSPLNTGVRPHVHGLATADFNSDSWPDIAVDSADTRQVVVLHGASPGYGEAMPIPVATMPYYRIGAGDLTGDEIAELIVPGHSDQAVHIIQYQSGSYSLYRTIKLDGQPWVVVADDVNADGQNDVVVIETDAVSIWLASPPGFAPAPGSPYPIKGATGVTTGDINDDDISDVIVGPWDREEVVIIQGGDFVIERASMCQRPVGLAVADLSGDAKPELLAACLIGHKIVVRHFSQG